MCCSTHERERERESGTSKLQANALDFEETVQKRLAMIADVPGQLVAIEAGSIKTMMKECPAKFRAVTFPTLIDGIATSHRMHSTGWRSNVSSDAVKPETR